MSRPYEVEYSEPYTAMSENFLSNVREKVKDTMEQNRVQLEDFEGFYPDLKLRTDAEYVAIRKASFENPLRAATPEQIITAKHDSEMAQVLEALLIDPKVINSWYSRKDEKGNSISEVRSMGTSELDDLANGVDAVLEFKDSERGVSHLALAVDVTYSTQFKDKLARIKGNIERGELSKVEYFLPKWGQVQGVLSRVPLTVVGVDADHMAELATIWLHMDTRRGELEKHPAQIILVKEMSMQLEVYRKYAESLGKKDIASLIAVAENQVNLLLKQCEDKKKVSIEEMRHDRVFNALENYLISFDSIESKHVSTNQLRQQIYNKLGKESSKI